LTRRWRVPQTEVDAGASLGQHDDLSRVHREVLDDVIDGLEDVTS
jgi:hypothetical protein